MLKFALYFVVLASSQANVKASQRDLFAARCNEYYKKYAELSNNKDAAGLEVLMRTVNTKNYTDLIPQRKGKKELQASLNDEVLAMKRTMSENSALSVKTKVDQIEFGGNSALVTRTDEVHILSKEKPPKRYILLSTDVDSWIKLQGKWRIRQCRSVSQRMQVNGRWISKEPAGNRA